MRAPRSHCFSPHMSNRHLRQLKKSKSWGPFWSYQLDTVPIKPIHLKNGPNGLNWQFLAGFPGFSHLWLSAGRWGSNRGQRSLRFYEGTSPSKSQVKAASASKQPQRPRKKAKTKLFPQLVANRPSMCDLSDSSVQNIHSTTQCGIYKIKKKCENIILFTPSPGTSS